ncbi:DUF6262 family protein [Streptomyces fulvorobeus]|uniref:Uncharacterized protein n=1 Tax=Streptomyces fulvorobeus TaxID=284028 RepID=A0A7J0CCH2_9ACTN|nr:DUF6262 family protein [Streptomyces fulvorobeus]NYE43735.1 hypothetical protein [Streptomyces fulvorobeus]GFN00221.1 hypothetical protein Sfulv_50310 [Streptomyces fulvorobeus]
MPSGRPAVCGTAQALRARSQKTEAGRVRIRSVVDQLTRSGGPITVAAVARQAVVSRTFLYEHAGARNLVAEAALRACGLRARTAQTQREVVEASWRERALNTEVALKATNAEVVNQRERIAELLGRVAELQGEWTDADVLRITTANVALRREVRVLTAERARLTKRLAAARDNARFADKRIAALEVQIAEQFTAPPSPAAGALRPLRDPDGPELDEDDVGVG